MMSASLKMGAPFDLGGVPMVWPPCRQRWLCRHRRDGLAEENTRPREGPWEMLRHVFLSGRSATPSACYWYLVFFIADQCPRGKCNADELQTAPRTCPHSPLSTL